MSEELVDFYYTARDEAYLRMVREEAEFWDRNVDDIFASPAAPPVQAYYNERFTDDPAVEWHEVIPRYREFKRGCLLGCGFQRIERQILAQNSSLHLTLYDISGNTLALRLSQFGGEFPGRVDTRQQDLNFAELPEDAYDLIVSGSCMHHIVNLEHVAFQANKALTPDGFFFLYDFVAESRLRFSDTKKRVYEAIAHAAAPKLEAFPPLAWPDPTAWKHSPFEAVRSGDTLGVFRNYLQEIDLRTAGALLMLPLFAKLPSPRLPEGRWRLWDKLAAAWARRRRTLTTIQLQRRLYESRQLGDLLLVFDRIISDSGCLRPGMAFAVYRKRQEDRPGQEA